MASPGQLSPIKQRLLEKLLRTEAQRQLREAPIEPRPRTARVPLAPCQHQIWLHAQLNPQAPVYNAPVTLHFHGSLDRAALERALDEMIQRHEIWRTTFAYIDGQVVQAIHDRLPIEIPFHDLTLFPEAGREAEAIRLATADAQRPFDLSVGPLMRARLIKLATEEYRLFLVQHHLIHDGVTIYGVLMSELPAIYDAFSQGKPSPFPAPALQYADFALWQKRFLENDSQAQIAYWREKLAGELQPLDLPSDRPRPAVFSFRGATADFTVPADLAAAVRDTAHRESVTPFAILLAAFKTLLFRYTGQNDILVGTFTDTRPRAEFANMAGFLMNTIALRTRPNPNRAFRDYLHEVKDTVLDALAHRDVPLDRVLRDLRWSRDPSRHPLFEASFTLVPALPVPDPRWKRTESEVSAGSAKWDLDFQLDERDGGYAARLTYSTDLFDPGTIERLFRHWLILLEAAIANPEARLIDLPLLTEDEIHAISIVRNATHREVPPSTIPQLFERQAALTPSAIALECGASKLTYAELNRQSNRLARRLQENGARPGTLVALCVDRSCEMVAAILAVLKTGAAYVPIDPEIPLERRQFILEDSQAPLLVTEERIAASFRKDAADRLRIVGCHEVSGDGSNLGALASPDEIAHVLYTSGSTGKPKGVEVPHRAVVNFLHSMRRQPGFSASDKLLAVTTISFDIAGLELYLPLICGGRIILARTTEARDPILLRQLIEQHAPTVMQATPATWRGLIETGWPGCRGMKILCGGEALPRDLADELLTRSAEVWNMYGPTETTIWSTIQRVEPGSAPVPIGRPIDNTQVYVLDSEGRLVPDGVTGELYIGGDGLARGYLRRPELTSEKFVQVQVCDGRLYRTGDLARWRNDGSLECRGRADNQVKIRGFRVELEEIEAAMAQHPDVSAAAVKAWPDSSGHLALAGYVVAAGNPDIRGFLRQKLPDYMVPSVYIRMEKLPLTPNLKVDRNRLPSPEMGRERTPFVPSENETERQLAGIWESVLEVKSIGVHDDFFLSGGHSLLVAKLLSRVEQNFGVRLPMTSLFEAPTIREFAKLLKSTGIPPGPVRSVAIRNSRSKRPVMWLYPGVEMRKVIENSPRPVVGVALSPQDEAALPQDFTLAQVAAYLVREIRASQPEGPYSIGGWCNAGILAYEVASQLHREGAEIDLLVLLDALNPVTYLATSPRRRRATKLKYHFQRVTSMAPSRVPGYLREHMSWARERFLPQTRTYLHSYEKRFSQAILNYVPPSYPGHVLVLTAEWLPAYRDPLLHWKDRVTGELDVRRVRGDHISMFEESASEIASVINSILTIKETERESQAPYPLKTDAAAQT